jgi:potassium/sodium efflux P-type ATPase
MDVIRKTSGEIVEVVRNTSKDAAFEIERKLSPRQLSPREPALLEDPEGEADGERRTDRRYERRTSLSDTTKDSPVPIELVPIEALVRNLDTDQIVGLQPAAAQQRLNEDGLNELIKPKQPSFLALFVAQLLNVIILLLIGAAAASVVVGSVATAVAILVIVLLNAGIAAYTEHQAGNALEALSKMSQAETKVLRGGAEPVLVPSNTLVRGDVVVLGVGDVIPADIRVVEAADRKVTEMPLTGESVDVSKSAKIKAEAGKLTPENMLFSGCNVTSGTTRGVVVLTGMRTRVGNIAALLVGEEQKGKCGGWLPDTSANQTPLQKSLQALGVQIGGLAIAVCIIVLVVGLALGTKDPNKPDSPSWLFMILVAVTLTVAAIPEGIPLCVTIALSTGCREMVKRNVLVTKLPAVETLGSASVICSDKTGTLTEGKMTAVKMWSGGVPFAISGAGFDPTTGSITRADNGDDARQVSGVRSTLLAGLLCSNAKVERKAQEDGSMQWVPEGNSSEVPIVVAAAKAGLSSVDAEKNFPRLFEIPFSSERKMMLSVCKASSQSHLGEGGVPLASGTEIITCLKGAPNYILDACARWATNDGTLQPLSEEVRSSILGTIDDLSSQALRVLAVAVRPLSQLPFDMDKAEDISADEKMEHLCKDLTFLGLVASIDPPREGVRDSVEACYAANIRVMMITGDYLKTAEAIARDIGIIRPGEDGKEEALDSVKLRPDGDYVNDEEFDKLTAGARVFARARPKDKLKIVESLQRQGSVCAMTGDGVNDAPALKAANIGVAMGIQGTEVAKGASDMILQDDNFCSIVSAVEKGRVLYSGIQKFVAFIMSVHIAEVIQIFACVCSEVPVMRTPLQILFLILVTDLAPSIALGMEPGQKGIMLEPPRPAKQPILLRWMWVSTIVNGMILSAVIMCVYVWGLHHFVDELDVDEIASDIREEGGHGGYTSVQLMKARTVAFIALVWSENVRAYTSRSFTRPFFCEMLSNVFMQKAIGIAQTALYLALFLPGLSDLLGLQGVAIGAAGWLAAFVGAVSVLVICEIFKLLQRMQQPVQAKSDGAKPAAPTEKKVQGMCSVGSNAV